MGDGVEALRGAGEAASAEEVSAGCAVVEVFVFERGAAFGAMGGDGEWGGGGGSFFNDDGFYAGDDFAGPFDEDGIADAEVEACDFGEVVEGGVGDDGTGDKDGLEACDGGGLASAADLDVDAEEGCFLFFCDEFVGDGPFGGFGEPAEAVLFGVGVYFEDNAVDIEGDGGAVLFDE